MYECMYVHQSLNFRYCVNVLLQLEAVSLVLGSSDDKQIQGTLIVVWIDTLKFFNYYIDIYVIFL